MKESLYQLLIQGTNISFQQAFIYILTSVLLGFVIYISYYITHAGTIYSKKFNVSLVMLTILTCTVMLVIGNNLSLSLGMVGALSIVRYRTAIKDSRDTAYIFWAIIAGICCGAGDQHIAIAGSIAVFIVLLLLGRVRNDDRKLVIIKGSRSIEKNVEGVMFKLCAGRAILRVKNTTRDTIEFIYELKSKHLETGAKKGYFLTDELYKIDKVDFVNVVSQNDEITG